MRDTLNRLRGSYRPIVIWQQLALPTHDESLVEAMLRLGTAAVRCISPYNLLLGRGWLPGSLPGDVYVLGWLGVLVAACVVIAFRQSQVVAWLIFLITTFRLIDIFAAQLGIVLVDRKRDGHRFQSIERSVILALMNVGQAIVGFGLLSNALVVLFGSTFMFATDCHNMPNSAACTGTVPPQSVFDYVYMSWGQLLTVGSKYSPVTAGAATLHMLMVASGLLLIGLSLATFIGGLVVKGPAVPGQAQTEPAS